eukprot:RCo033483
MDGTTSEEGVVATRSSAPSSPCPLTGIFLVGDLHNPQASIKLFVPISSPDMSVQEVYNFASSSASAQGFDHTLMTAALYGRSSFSPVLLERGSPIRVADEALGFPGNPAFGMLQLIAGQQGGQATSHGHSFQQQNPSVHPLDAPGGTPEKQQNVGRTPETHARVSDAIVAESIGKGAGLRLAAQGNFSDLFPSFGREDPGSCLQKSLLGSTVTSMAFTFNSFGREEVSSSERPKLQDSSPAPPAVPPAAPPCRTVGEERSFEEAFPGLVKVSAHQKLVSHSQSTVEKVKPETLKNHLFRLMRGSRWEYYWNMFLVILAVAGVVLYIVDSYQVDQALAEAGYAMKAVAAISAIFFSIDIIINILISPTIYSYFLKWDSWVDIISVIPLFTMFTPYKLAPFLTVFRMFRLTRVYRILRLTKSGTPAHEISSLIYAVSMMIMTFAAFFLIMESDLISNFHDGFYMAVVTMTTVGYGDLAPRTTAGRLFTCVWIFMTWILIPTKINKLVDSLMLQSPYAGSYKSSGAKEHVLVTHIGPLDRTTLQLFLEEFFHKEHGRVHCDVVILGATVIPRETKRLIRSHITKGRATYLQGSALNVRDLRRCCARDAKAIFVLSSRYLAPAAREEADAEAILVVMSFRNHNPEAPIFIQAQLPHNKHLLLEVGATEVVCEAEQKLQLVAASCFCPGLHTLLGNLIANFHTKNLPDQIYPWMFDYIRGATHQLYEFVVDTTAIAPGQSFKDVCLSLYRNHAVILIGIRDGITDNVLLNPAHGRPLKASDSLIIVAAGPEDAKRAIQVELTLLENTIGRIPGAMLVGELGMSIAQTVGLLDLFPATPVEGSAIDRGDLRLPSFRCTRGSSATDYLFDFRARQYLPRLPREVLSFTLKPLPAPPTTSPLVVASESSPMGGPGGERPREFAGTSLERLERNLLVDHLPEEVTGHVVVVGSLLDVLSFALPLRAKVLGPWLGTRPIVLVTAEEPSESALEQLDLIQDVYVLVGNIEMNAMRAHLHQAHALVILTGERGADSPVEEEGGPSSTDYTAMLLCMRLRAVVPTLYSIVALDRLHNARFLTRGIAGPADMLDLHKEDDGLTAESQSIAECIHPAYAMGQVYAEVTTAKYLCMLYYRPVLGPVMRQLLCTPHFTSPASPLPAPPRSSECSSSGTSAFPVPAGMT